MMDRCKEIEAHVRMEERYQGLSLVFAHDDAVKSDIITAIDEAKEETGQTPFILEKISNDRADLHVMCIEFHDDFHREGGEFLEKVLHKLNINKCESDL